MTNAWLVVTGNTKNTANTIKLINQNHAKEIVCTKFYSWKINKNKKNIGIVSVGSKRIRNIGYNYIGHYNIVVYYCNLLNTVSIT